MARAGAQQLGRDERGQAWQRSERELQHDDRVVCGRRPIRYSLHDGGYGDWGIRSGGWCGGDGRAQAEPTRGNSVPETEMISYFFIIYWC
jgi:hypothetical protein